MIVDFHNHFLPRSFPVLPAGVVEPAWPRMEVVGDKGQMFTGDKPFRAFDSLYWDVEKRIAGMDAEGTDVQLISPLPEILSYWLDARAAVALTDGVNRACADMVAQAPDRLKGLAVLALQDPVTALRQVRALDCVQGIVGLFVGSNVNGVSIANERFDPIWAECARQGLIVFVHGIRPAGAERLEGPPLMSAVVGIPQENTLAIASFMMRDILGRYPGLELVFSHGGGGIGAVIDRMSLIWNNFPGMREQLAIPPIEYARRFWYDTAVFGAEYLNYLVTQFGADRILAGTDGPTEIGQKNVPAFVASAGIGGEDGARICGGNAAHLFATRGRERREAA